MTSQSNILSSKVDNIPAVQSPGSSTRNSWAILDSAYKRPLSCVNRRPFVAKADSVSIDSPRVRCARFTSIRVHDGAGWPITRAAACRSSREIKAVSQPLNMKVDYQSNARLSHMIFDEADKSRGYSLQIFKDAAGNFSLCGRQKTHPQTTYTHSTTSAIHHHEHIPSPINSEHRTRKCLNPPAQATTSA